METIRNKVQESGLISMDLANYKPSFPITEIDLAEQLWQGLVLKEKDFRSWIKENDWSAYQGKAVYIHCSADAIIPTWAYMLVASQLEGNSESYLVGTREDLLKKLIRAQIAKIDLSTLKDGKVIIKGCSDIPFPDFAMVTMIEHIQPVVKSIMYGEPCSTVPVFKRK